MWDDGAHLSLPSLDGEYTADVCVIGLGGSGLACITELHAHGLAVIGVDANDIGSGAAGRNGGFLLAGIASFHHDAVEAHGREHARTMYRRTLEEMDRMQAETPALVSRPGSVRLAESEEEVDDCELQRSAMRADGFAVEYYTGEDGRGLLIPGDGVFNPFARCQALARAAADRGAMLFARSPVAAIDGGSVVTNSGRIAARTIVVAVDGRLEQILPELAGEVRTARLQMLATAPTAEVTLTRPVYARWGYDYWQQLPTGEIALGGARDIGGDAEWTCDTAVTGVVQSALERRLRHVLNVTAPVTRRWAASVSYTRDELPIAREVRENVWALGGYSGTGNVVGSLLGRGVARVIARKDDSLIAPFVV